MKHLEAALPQDLWVCVFKSSRLTLEPWVESDVLRALCGKGPGHLFTYLYLRFDQYKGMYTMFLYIICNGIYAMFIYTIYNVYILHVYILYVMFIYNVYYI